MENIIFTIAVMIYNVEKFLSQCIDSCIKQIGNDIEILLIDDGSTDRSGTICDEYAERDSRVSVIHKQNGGVSTARNTAINNAKGKWLIMVDGDDVLTDNAIEYGRNYIDDDSDLLQFDTVTFTNFLDLNEWKPKGKEMLVTGDRLRDYHIQLIDRSNVEINFPTYNINPAWSKMWNMNFIKKYNLLYDEKVHKGEGTLFTFTSSYVMKKIRIIPYVIYGYRLNPTSIMHRFSPDILENQDVQWLQYFKVIDEHHESGDEDIINALNRRGLYLIENAIHLGIAHPDCKWDKEQKLEWVRKLCGFSWVQQAVKYGINNNNSKDQKLIFKQDYARLVCFYNKLRHRKMMGDAIRNHQLGSVAVKIYQNLRYKAIHN